MGKNSQIEWTHHTFNPWWGCAKVSPACKNCYAEAWARRVGQSVWGAKAERRFFGENHWQEPLRWNREAERDGSRRRVFCASMADVFERRAELNVWRDRLWDIIEETPALDWLLLTKRPQNISTMTPWAGGNWPANVWLGTTVENQTAARQRLPNLLAHNAAVRFLSCEPLLSDLSLDEWINDSKMCSVDWVIAGGESGASSRPMNPQWLRNLRDQCLEQGIPFHFKQWGHWAPVENPHEPLTTYSSIGELATKMIAVGKKRAGRELDGVFWDQVPAAVS